MRQSIVFIVVFSKVLTVLSVEWLVFDSCTDNKCLISCYNSSHSLTASPCLSQSQSQVSSIALNFSLRQDAMSKTPTPSRIKTVKVIWCGWIQNQTQPDEDLGEELMCQLSFIPRTHMPYVNELVFEIKDRYHSKHLSFIQGLLSPLHMFTCSSKCNQLNDCFRCLPNLMEQDSDPFEKNEDEINSDSLKQRREPIRVMNSDIKSTEGKGTETKKRPAQKTYNLLSSIGFVVFILVVIAFLVYAACSPSPAPEYNSFTTLPRRPINKPIIRRTVNKATIRRATALKFKDTVKLSRIFHQEVQDDKYKCERDKAETKAAVKQVMNADAYLDN